MTIDELVAEVVASSKYSSIDPAIVEQIAVRELTKGRSAKAAIKAIKQKLHQIAGAYFTDGSDRALPYTAWLTQLRDLASADAAKRAAPGEMSDAGGGDQIARYCREIMRAHASTRERLPFIASFYAAIFAALPPIRHIADLACGLNPLAAWAMPLAEEDTGIPTGRIASDSMHLRVGDPPRTPARYFACDLYPAMVTFVAQALPLIRRGIIVTAAALDLTQEIPPGQYDVAFLLKLIPCLDQIDRQAAKRLIEQIDATHLVISFPARSLGGRDVGMAATYDARLRELLADRAHVFRRLDFPTEIVYVVTRDAGRAHDDTNMLCPL